jgi:hypothetical protein
MHAGWIFVTHYANNFDTSLRHDVYVTLTPDANYLALNDAGTELTSVTEDIDRLKDLIDMLNCGW